MGISTAGHLPSITSTSYPALTSHLLSAYNAQKVGNWTVSVRVLRSVLSLDNQDGTDGSHGNQTRAKLMYVVQMSEFPNDTFVLIEDSQSETRASIRAKHAMSVMQAAAVAAVSSTNQENSTASQQIDAEPKAQNGVDASANSIQAETQVGGEEDVKMGDVKQDEKTEGKKEEESKKDEASATEEHDRSTDAPASAAEVDDLFSDPPNSSETQHAEQVKPSQIASEPAGNSSPILPSPDFSYVSERPTRHTLFAASAQYLLLLSRLNLPAPLGAPSVGDGGITAAHAGPGAWVPRGAPVSIQGATYDIPSATGYGSGGAEWRVRLGMVQSSGTRSAGALVESEYLPILRLASDTFLSNYLHNLFPAYLTTPSQATTQQNVNGLLQTGVAHSAPTPEQWQEVIPASNQAWMESVGITSTNDQGMKEAQRLPLQQKDRIGWQGKERGRRLAYLYITLLRNQSVI
ncbi:uncharacterized protein FA14DRAFT_70445 [Meira miltonrushii]|uniref:Mediator of RNA polymerase II transcription subunit 20 n=1 Tax=Meira miltonrushii TaxID=1280837 RepID=A0A316VE14_9BASI|nr:uncharacterized protein FA14DRAFT_70445 [Meira miltonrushii]PWN34241.1 hypothetical protein FA14DRAFT_70445 [Meira miltonrushii]